MAGIQMPDDGALPPGPFRDLVAAVHELYRNAGTPPTRKISQRIRDSDDLPGTLSHEGVSAILRGTGRPPRWPNLESLIRVLCAEGVDDRDADAEVRRVHLLWQAAIAGPAIAGLAIAGPAERNGHPAEPELSLGSRELDRVRLANRDWVISTGAAPFVRLLQAINEVESPAGRLEAGRALRRAVLRSGAAGRATVPTLLAVCDQLDATGIYSVNWKLRRMLSRVIGDIVESRTQADDLLAVGGFCEPRLYTERGPLQLAEAAAEHTTSAASIGLPVVRRLLLSPQPQVAWQLLRRWPVLSPVVAEGVSPQEALDVRSASIRRMLVLAQMPAARRDVTALRDLLGAAKDTLTTGPAQSFGDGVFFDALADWAYLNTSLDVRRSTAEPIRLAEMLATPRWPDGGSATRIAQALERDSIEQDLKISAGSAPARAAEKSSEGRYGHTRDLVRAVLARAPQEFVEDVLRSLLGCTDEGIRWAVAAEILHWWTLVPDPDVATGLVLGLLHDEHPWVVRETLQQLTADEILCQAIGIDLLADLARAGRARFAAQEWLTPDLAAAIRKMLALAET